MSILITKSTKVITKGFTDPVAAGGFADVVPSSRHTVTHILCPIMRHGG